MGELMNCSSGRYAKGYAERRLRRYSRISAGGSLLPVCRFGARSPGCERCTHSGLVTPTLGCVTATRCNRHGASAAEPMIRTCETALIGICAMPLRLRRRLIGDGAQRDFPVVEQLAIAGATDYVAELIPVGMVSEAFPDSGIGFSFATDHIEGFGENDLKLIQALLPAVALAIMSDAEHTIAAELLAAYLGADAGRRVHAGVVERGSVESIRAVLWYADIRGFTPLADATPGPVLIEMLDDVFEALTAALRPRGAQVLKFLGDGMLASFAFVGATCSETCCRALDAAAEAMRSIDRLNADRTRIGKPIAVVDLALHVGEVLYGNVGAVDRLDFTVIGPAVNEVARIETLCEPLGRKVLVSAALAAAVADGKRLQALGAHVLRGVREPTKIFALRL